MSDPYEAGPPEYQPDEDPGDDDAALFAGAAYEMAGWEYIEQQQREAEPERTQVGKMGDLLSPEVLDMIAEAWPEDG